MKEQLWLEKHRQTPEKLALAESLPSDGANAVRARLTAASYLGERSHYFLQVDGLAEPLSIARQNTTAQILHETDAGSELWLTWSPSAGIVLPAED